MKGKLLICASVLLCAALGGTALLGGGNVRANAAEKEVSNVLANTYSPDTKLVNPPTVVYDVKNGQSLETLLGALEGERPSNAIFRLNGNGDMVGENGAVIGDIVETFRAIEGKVIPVLSLESEASADAAIAILTEEIDILDLAVMSSDPATVKRVREADSKIRGIVSYDGDETGYELVSVTNSNLANVAVLPQSAAGWETVTYVQARFKTVWVALDSTDEVSLHGAIMSGAYGIITDDFSAVYDAIESYTETTYARMPFNVAHRGLPETHNENSVSGTLAAIEAGATHVELDGMLTTDGRIMMMHDNNISRTANGNGLIESMTYEQVRQYKLKLHEPLEDIPTLEEIIETLRGTDVILVFEIKSAGTDIVSVLKEVLDETDFYEQVVVIAFGYPAIERMREELPQVPVADLNSYSESTLASKLPTLGEYNCGVDTSGSSSAAFNKMLRDRGIVGWYWTQSTDSAVDTAFQNGLMGLTNNVGAYFGNKEDIYRVVTGQDFKTEIEPAAGDAVTVITRLYNGDMAQAQGTLWKVADRGAYYDAIAQYTSGEMTYYTPTFRIEKTGALLPKNNLGLIIGLSAGGAALVVAVVVTVAVLKKKKK